MSILQFSKSASSWSQKFTLSHVKCLIVCRGPIRKEAMEIFDELGTQPSGILLSEKDSIVYPQTLAPELRMIEDKIRSVHRIPDYVGATKEEKLARIDDIIQICKEYHYTHVFAGYGFMAEDAEFVQFLENAGLNFVGPNSDVIRQAGSKDEAKLLARSLGVSVTPGVDNITALTLLRKAGDNPEAYLSALGEKHQFTLPANEASLSLIEQAEQVLQASYQAKVDLISIEEIQAETKVQVQTIWEKFAGKRIRFKHIGGGGGKGQRVIQHESEIDNAVKEVLIESKATGVGDNKNFLIELNIEDTRHNEIQLLGNGEWCIALGGRDCSLQMHEQKLLEVSLNQAMLEASIREHEKRGEPEKVEELKGDLQLLQEMCSQAESFGEAVKLDSASTFESIVEDNSYFFMEMNTRIQVEHRVTEMVYSLKFVNPEDESEYFILDSLVGAMMLIACYAKDLPKPLMIPRYVSGAEVRVNATNQALKPHAGGILRGWSEPIEGELRDDQGIGIRNHDTGLFQPYHLAGAYDSNVALIVAHGTSRLDNFLQLAEILRCMEIRGSDLQLNVEFHYGLLHWLIGNDVMLKPNTRFVVSYLALVGKLQQIANEVNLDLAWKTLLKEVVAMNNPGAKTVFSAKVTLLTRPMQKLLNRPHLLCGWLAPKLERRWEIVDQKCQWIKNPLEVLSELYHYLRLEEHSGAPSEQIWADDQVLLQSGLAFYQELKQRLDAPQIAWRDLETLLKKEETPTTEISQELWSEIQASHRGFQLGMQLLMLPVNLGMEAQYFEFQRTGTFTVAIPAPFLDTETMAEYTTVLAPPPVAESNEVVSWTGGTFYRKETPQAEAYVEEGQHVEEGEILGLLEVMKMFNPIRAAFSGTIQKIYVDAMDGVVVARGQLLFTIDPDIAPVIESEEDLLLRQKEVTLRLLPTLL